LPHDAAPQQKEHKRVFDSMSTHPDDEPTRYERPWQRFTRSYRAVEFLVTAVLLILAPLFSFIDVHERTCC
jgi:hypothetical protein